MIRAGDDMEGYFRIFSLGGGRKGKKIDFPEACITWESWCRIVQFFGSLSAGLLLPARPNAGSRQDIQGR